MRPSTILAVLILWAFVAACGTDPGGPDNELQPADTAQSRGTLLVSEESVLSRATLAWIPGTDLVAFISWDGAGACAVKTLDTGAAATDIVDAGCVNPGSIVPEYFHELVATPDGSALYYTVGIGDPSNPTWVVGTTSLQDGSVSAVRSGVLSPLALSPDGRLLAYRVMDSLFVQELSSGTETHFPHLGEGWPILFSPDGEELLYREEPISPLTFRRVSLRDSTSERVEGTGGVRPLLFHWGSSGIEVLSEQGVPEQYYVINLETGATVQVGDAEGEWHAWGIGRAAWSRDGTHVAYWIGRCFEVDLFDCVLARYALFVGDTRSGTWSRVAYTSAGSGPVAFAPDGRHLVYFDPEGKFYLVTVP